MKDTNYVVIQGWMCNELKLKGNDLLVFALIYGFSQDGETEFRAGRKYIADTFNISLPTVDKSLQSLLDKSYIIKRSTNDYINPNTYKVHIQVVKKLYEGSKETLHVGSKETLPDKYSNTDNTKVLSDNKNKKENKDKSQKVIELYHSICVSLPKVRNITDKRKKAIQSLFKKGYTITDFEEAFSKAEASDFMKGKNDRGWKAGLDFLLREDKFVKTIEGAYSSKSKKEQMQEREGIKGGVVRYTKDEKSKIKEDLKNGKYQRI